MKAIELLDELAKIIEAGNSIPFTQRAMIIPDEALEIIAEIKQSLPREIREAEDIVERKNQIIIDAQNEAETIKNEADRILKEMTNENKVLQEAQLEAKRIIENANTSAEEIKKGTYNYTDNLLYSVQVFLKQVNEEIKKSREDLDIINDS